MSRNQKPIWPIDKGSSLEIIEVTRGASHRQKMINRSRIIGYAVGGGGKGAPFVRPIYETQTWVSFPTDKKKVMHIFHGHLVGGDFAGNSYGHDPMGCTMAETAASSIRALENRYFKDLGIRRRKGKKT